MFFKQYKLTENYSILCFTEIQPEKIISLQQQNMFTDSGV